MGVKQGEHVEPKIAIFLQSRACFCAKLRFWHNGGEKQESKQERKFSLAILVENLKYPLYIIELSVKTIRQGH